MVPRSEDKRAFAISGRGRTGIFDWVVYRSDDSLARSCRCYGSAARIAIVGPGPAGFYTAQALMKFHRSVEVDIIEKLPVPYGLVRYGVAPDHQNVKQVTRQFRQVAKCPQCRFIGSVEVGVHVSVAKLRHFYSGIVFNDGTDLFKPERWDRDNHVAHPNMFASLPFGHGPRILGHSLSYTVSFDKKL